MVNAGTLERNIARVFLCLAAESNQVKMASGATKAAVACALAGSAVAFSGLAPAGLSTTPGKLTNQRLSLRSVRPAKVLFPQDQKLKFERNCCSVACSQTGRVTQSCLSTVKAVFLRGVFCADVELRLNRRGVTMPSAQGASKL
jgi:hypothetical protein